MNLFEKIKPKLGNWADKFSPLFFTGKMDDTYIKLKAIGASGDSIFPTSMNLYRSFKECSLNELKCVIIGDIPYNYTFNNIIVDNGIWLDCSNLNFISEKLKKFYKAIEEELYEGLNLNYIEDRNIEYLIKQGVLIIPCSLTCTSNENHFKLWKPFIEFLLTDILKHYGIPILFIGKEAKKYAWITEDTNYCFILEDIPTEINKKWNTNNVFKQINTILEKTNKESIMWLNIDCPY